MTEWTPQQLRREGTPWPGLNTRGGRLDDGSGQLEDGSINVQINSADVLSKRDGMVRGLDEWFGSVVCGLFRYTDYCGREFLLVADEDGINIRQPFTIPSTATSDAYPNDDFVGTGSIDADNWRNTGRYTRLNGNMVQVAGAASFSGTRLDPEIHTRWFKAAGSFSYLTELNSYVFDPALQQEQRVGIIIRGNGDLSTGALLQAQISFNPANGLYRVEAFHRDGAEVSTRLLEADIAGSVATPRGTLSLSYERDLSKETFTPKLTILPGGGTFQAFTMNSLTRVQDTDLGLVSAIALGQGGGTLSTSIGIEAVQGRAI